MGGGLTKSVSEQFGGVRIFDDMNAFCGGGLSGPVAANLAGVQIWGVLEYRSIGGGLIIFIIIFFEEGSSEHS